MKIQEMKDHIEKEFKDVDKLYADKVQRYAELTLAETKRLNEEAREKILLELGAIDKIEKHPLRTLKLSSSPVSRIGRRWLKHNFKAEIEKYEEE